MPAGAGSGVAAAEPAQAAPGEHQLVHRQGRLAICKHPAQQQLASQQMNLAATGPPRSSSHRRPKATAGPGDEQPSPASPATPQIYCTAQPSPHCGTPPHPPTPPHTLTRVCLLLHQLALRGGQQVQGQHLLLNSPPQVALLACMHTGEGVWVGGSQDTWVGGWVGAKLQAEPGWKRFC